MKLKYIPLFCFASICACWKSPAWDFLIIFRRTHRTNSMFTHPHPTTHGGMHVYFTPGLLLSVCVIAKEQFNIFITQWLRELACENFREV